MNEVTGYTQFLVLAGAVILVSNLILIFFQQRQLNFIHPGWVLCAVLSFYGLAPGIYIIESLEKQAPLMGTLDRHFTTAAFEGTLELYLCAILGFFLAQLCVQTLQSIRIPHLTGFMQERWAFSGASFFAGIALLIIGVYIMTLHYGRVGGLGAFMAYELRRDAYADLVESSVFSRFQLVFHSAFVLMVLSLFTTKQGRSFRLRSLSLLLVGYLGFIFLTGNRLETIVVSIGVLSCIYAFDRGCITRRWKGLLLAVAICFFLFSWHTYGKHELRKAFSSGEQLESSISVDTLFPAEALTGYFPALVFFNYRFEAPQGMSYAYSVVPSSVARMLGIVKPSLSDDLIALLGARSAVYTITLPVDIYFLTGSLAIVILISMLIYFLFFSIMSFLIARGPFGFGLCGIVSMNLWYVIRVDAANWVSRLWQDCVVYGISVAIVFIFEYWMRRCRRLA